MAKRRSSRRKQADTENGTGGTGKRSTATEAATPETQKIDVVETAVTPTVTGTDGAPQAGITETVTAGEELLPRLQAALVDLDGKLAAADRTLESLAEGIDFPEVLGETLENLQTTVDQLKQQLPEAVRYNTESIVALHAQVAELETASAQSAVGEGVAVDETALAKLRVRIQELDAQLNDGQQRIDANDGEVRQAIFECRQRIETELQARED
ncbi:MAG: hypothetical protein AAF974_09905, partial [Cyanobacteria bacterium P01_E01_bin.34]